MAQDAGLSADGATAYPDASVADADAAADADAGTDDSGPVQWGDCDCAFGFHHQCPSGYVCAGGQRYADGEHPNGTGGRRPLPAVCNPMQPRGGALHGGCFEPGVTEAPAVREACDAVCVPADSVKICSGRSASRINGIIDDILSGYAAGYNKQPNLCSDAGCGTGFPAATRYWAARQDDLECTDFLATTVLGFMQLCAGDLLPSGSHAPYGWVHQTPAHTPLSSLLDHNCAQLMGIRCALLLDIAVAETEPENVREWLAELLERTQREECSVGQQPFHSVCRDSESDPAACAVDWVLTVRRAIDRKIN